MFNYILEASIFWGIAFLLYKIFLEKQTYYKLNRGFLLFSIIAGALLPFLNLGSLEVSLFKISLEPLIVSINEIQGSEVHPFPASLSAERLLWLVYWGGLILLSLRLLLSLRKITRLFFKHEKSKEKGFSIIKTGKAHPPFSFFTTIFIGEEKQVQPVVLQHELAHIKGLHSIDIMFFQLIALVHWFNPLIWLLGKELRTTHEYIADDYALNFSRKKEYSYILLQFAGLGFDPLLSSNFNSQTKKRIKMMFKKKSSTFAYAFFPLSLVLVFSLGLLLSCNETVKGDQQIIQDKTEVVSDNKEIYDEVDQLPRFPGCEGLPSSDEMKNCTYKNLMTFISQNIKYPEEARKEGLMGTVYVKFVINAKGELVDPAIEKGFNDACEDEVIRVINLLQAMDKKWGPGIKDEKEVNTSMMLPVTFKLDNKKEK